MQVYLTKTVFLSILLFGLLTACGSDTASTNETGGDAATPAAATPVTAPPAELKRPTGCNFLTDEQVLEAIKPETEPNISTQIGSTVSTCYYRIDSRYWAADLMVEVADGSRADAIIKQVKNAPATEKLKVGGHDATMKNDNRILTVSATPPYEIKLSVLAKEGYKEVKTSEDRRAIIMELARMLEEKI